jgi:hypothetical protein
VKLLEVCFNFLALPMLEESVKFLCSIQKLTSLVVELYFFDFLYPSMCCEKVFAFLLGLVSLFHYLDYFFHCLAWKNVFVLYHRLIVIFF